MSGVMEAGLDQIDADIDVAAIRDQYAAAVIEAKARGETGPIVAQKAGIAYSTQQAWLSGKYTGDCAGVARKAKAWLLSREARERTQTTVRKKPGFMKTKTATQIFDVLEYAQTAPDMAVISGGAGLGKTTAINAYQAVSSNVWIITAEPLVATVTGLLDRLMEAIGVEAGYRGNMMSKRIKHRLTGTDGLVIVDEAQHLTAAQREQLRMTVHDGAEIGMAWVGNDVLNSRYSREQATGQNAQLISRFGQRLNRAKPYRSDVDLLLQGWGIEGAEAVTVATGIAMQPGALRQMNKALRIAYSLSDLRGDEEPTAADIQTAWKQLGGVV